MDIIWLWGRPCSGKTTIAKKLNDHYISKGKRIVLLDGDITRSSNKNADFTPSGRWKQIKHIQNRLIHDTEHDIAIVALITPYYDMRINNRDILYNYYEVFVDVPIATADKRDVKGMYKKAKEGKIQNFTGISDPFDERNTADMTCYTKYEDIETSVNKIIRGAIWI